MPRIALLVCGTLSSLLYVGTDVLGALSWEASSYSSQAISEMTAVDAPRLAAQLPTPWLGITERLNLVAYLLWIAVLAVALLRDQRAEPFFPTFVTPPGSRS